MRFLKYIAMVPFVFLFSSLVQAEEVDVAGAKNKVIEGGTYLKVNYSLDDVSPLLTCSDNNPNGSHKHPLAKWMAIKGMAQSGEHNEVLPISVSHRYDLKVDHYVLVPKQGSITIYNNNMTPVTVSCALSSPEREGSSSSEESSSL